MIAPSRYLPAFLEANPDLAGLLTGDLLLVEAIPQEEVKTTSGIIIASDSRQVNTVKANLPHFVRVLAVGPGYYSEAEPNESVPLDTSPGAIIMVGDNSVKWWSHLPIAGYKPYEIGLTRESEVQLTFKTDEDFRRVFGAINRGLAPKVDSPGAAR